MKTLVFGAPGKGSPSRGGRGASRTSTVLAMAAAVAGVGVSAAGATAGFRTPTLHEARAATVSRLKAKHLTYFWVACIQTPHRYRGAHVVRCNVDFGDPHIVAYCTVFQGDAAVTQFTDPAIPCGPDLAGPQFTITSSR
jgi:hypothetical protein